MVPIHEGSHVIKDAMSATSDSVPKVEFGSTVTKGHSKLAVLSTYKVRLATGTASSSYRYAKRAVDFTLSVLGLLIISPFFLALALAVRLTSPGTVFYREKRVGQNGRQFTIFKFRTMYTPEYLSEVLGYGESGNAQMDRRQFGKHTHDPRITKPGRWMRKFSLDELPQLINVIKGDMSLVGPRPVVNAELANYGQYAVYYKLAKPGMTGLWQVSGRNDVGYGQRVRLDAMYCLRWSPWLDMSILARTLPAVLNATGAY